MTAQPSLSSLVSALGRARDARVKAYESYQRYKEVEDSLRVDLFALLQAQELRSAKGRDFTASIVARPSIAITHEPSVLEWLDHAPDIEKDMYVGLKAAAFKRFAEIYLKGTGEQIPGTELQLRETIAIKKNKER